MIRLLKAPLLLGCMLCSLYACAGTPVTSASLADQPVQVTLDGQTFALKQDQQGCALRKPDKSVLPLDIPWPCHFSVDPQGEAHVETYRNVPIVIVLHVMPIAGSRLECRSEYRAVRLINGKPEVSVIARSASCLRGAGDQKDYTAMFDW